MGKSFKKYPVIKDNQGTSKYLKRQANKRVRKHSTPLADGKSYRKVYDSYRIHDIVIHSQFRDEQEYLRFTLSLIEGGYFKEGVFSEDDLRDLEERKSYKAWKKKYLIK